MVENRYSRITSGNTRSCGCLHTETVKNKPKTHGMRKTAIWHVWAQMLQRCNNPRSQGYVKYGARGITVAKEWETFEAFYADMGDRPEGMTLGRIDNDGPYCRENCRWETLTQQARNKRNTTMVTFNGETKAVADWADAVGVSPKAMWDRIYKLKWPLDRALLTPALGKPWNKVTASMLAP